MKPGVALVVLVAATATARADDRSMYVNLGGTIGVGGPASGETAWGTEADAEGTLMARAFASWEAPPLPYREPDGYRWRPGVTPEVLIGRLRIADHRSGRSEDNAATFVAVGGRVELAFSQRRMGVLKLSTRGAFYLAGRAGLLTDAKRTPLVELALGESIAVTDTLRLGAEVGLISIFAERIREVPIAARGPWTDGSGQYLSGHLTVFLGFQL